MTERLGPQPWPGCDTSGEAWRRYCEAFSHLRDRSKSVTGIGQQRGWKAAMIIEHDKQIVRADYNGDIPDRSTLQHHMEWQPNPFEVQKRADLEKSRSAGRRR